MVDLARLAAEVVGFEGSIVTNPSKPDGTPRKLLHVSRLEAMGWKARIGLREGLADAYAWHLENASTARG
jgi:nucleoside-diphosphate-sugar epimerase